MFKNQDDLGCTSTLKDLCPLPKMGDSNSGVGVMAGIDSIFCKFGVGVGTGDKHFLITGVGTGVGVKHFL